MRRRRGNKMEEKEEGYSGGSIEEIELQKTIGNWGEITHIGTPFGVFAIKNNNEEEFI